MLLYSDTHGTLPHASYSVNGNTLFIYDYSKIHEHQFSYQQEVNEKVHIFYSASGIYVFVDDNCAVSVCFMAIDKKIYTHRLNGTNTNVKFVDGKVHLVLPNAEYENVEHDFGTIKSVSYNNMGVYDIVTDRHSFSCSIR